MRLSDTTTNNSSLQELPPAEWMLQQAKDLAGSDMFAARSWLLTAKSMFPRSFTVLYNAYKMEYDEKNSEQCASLLGEMFQEFPHEIPLWKEIENMIISLDKKDNYDAFKQKVFSHIPSTLKQRMIMSCAEQQTDIALQCKITLILIEKYPEAVRQYGIDLAEKLVDEEKVQVGNSPLNHQRRLLVCDVLPVICKNITVEISHKQFYKWLQKAAEFYAVYFTTDKKISGTNLGKLIVSWDDLENLRRYISEQCEWESTPGGNPTLQERMNHIKDLSKRSRTDLTGTINKKQIFYTAILLFLEAVVKYMEMLEPKIYQDRNEMQRQSHTLVVNWNDDDKTQSGEAAIHKELRQHFLVARDAWNVLHTNESFEKDFSHLYRRWKMDKWTWLQLFLADYFTFEKKHKTALDRLNNLMEQDVSRFRHPVVLHCHAQLVSSYYANDHLLMACQSIVECLGHMPDDKTSKSSLGNGANSARFCEVPTSAKLKLIPLSFSSLLPFWIHIFVQSFVKIIETGEDDSILGHLIVLCQHDWPKRQAECSQALDLISKRSKFNYSIFFDYVISMDILEEIAYLKNNSQCELVLLPDVPASHQRVTRGINKGVNEDFKKAMKRQIRKSEDCIDTLLRQFLTEQQDSILNCLQSQTSQEILEPMDVDI